LSGHLFVALMRADGSTTNFESFVHDVLAMTSAGDTIINEELHDHGQSIAFTVGAILTNGTAPFTESFNTLGHAITVSAVVASDTARASIFNMVSCSFPKSLVPLQATARLSLLTELNGLLNSTCSLISCKATVATRCVVSATSETLEESLKVRNQVLGILSNVGHFNDHLLFNV